MLRFWVALCAVTLSAQTQFFPLREVRAGQRGVGRTVFSGDKIEEFQAEILGVLENAGPKQSIILAKLSGGPLAHSGVLQGMSGSPVYISGRLVGAVALAYAFSKDPIAGIRPIEEMVQASRTSPRAASLQELAQGKRELAAGGARLIEIATPLNMAGFTARTIEAFLPQFRALGLEPMQGALGGRARGGAPGKLEPGSMISVQLITGDLAMSADGTVTHIDGQKVYAFGHRFLSIGSTDLPFSRAEVLTLLPNVNQSFKISAAREWMGSITADHTTAIAGELGRKARMVPVSVSVKGRDRYNVEVVRDRLMTPFLLQTMTFSALDATERLTGSATVAITGTLEFEKGAPIAVRNIYAGETAVPMAASLAGAVPLSYAMQSGFPEFDVKRVSLEVTPVEEKKQMQVEQLWLSRNKAKAGDSVDIYVIVSGPAGDQRRKFAWRVPQRAKAGALTVTAMDASAANLADYAYILAQQPPNAERVREVLNGLRASDTVAVRISSTEPTYVVQGQSMPDLPPSMALMLRRSPSGALMGPAAKLGGFEFRIDGFVVSGSKSAQLEIQE
ncbi:MAG: SpoIVB peptidase S55 domain-containing protein [Bryobacteraceae bacterium]